MKKRSDFIRRNLYGLSEEEKLEALKKGVEKSVKGLRNTVAVAPNVGVSMADLASAYEGMAQAFTDNFATPNSLLNEINAAEARRGSVTGRFSHNRPSISFARLPSDEAPVITDPDERTIRYDFAHLEERLLASSQLDRPRGRVEDEYIDQMADRMRQMIESDIFLGIDLGVTNEEEGNNELDGLPKEFIAQVVGTYLRDSKNLQAVEMTASRNVERNSLNVIVEYEIDERDLMERQRNTNTSMALGPTSTPNVVDYLLQSIGNVEHHEANAKTLLRRIMRVINKRRDVIMATASDSTDIEALLRAANQLVEAPLSAKPKDLSDFPRKPDTHDVKQAGSRMIRLPKSQKQDDNGP